MSDRENAFIKYLKEEGEDFDRDDISECVWSSECFEIDNKEYIVLNDNEADKRAKDDVEENLHYFNSGFLSRYLDIPTKAIEEIQQHCGEDCNNLFVKLAKCEEVFDHMIDEAIAADGRGHYIARYDGDEREVKHQNKWWYIYRND